MMTPQLGVEAGPVDSLAVADTVVSWLTPGGSGAVATQTLGWGPGHWAAAHQAALVHGIAPLLAAQLTGTSAWRHLDPELRAYCVEQRRLNGQRVTLMLEDLAAILHAAASVGVSALPLKGAILTTQFYREPGLRPMADLDLLVRPEHADRMGVALGRLGFQLTEETPRHRSYLRGPLHVASWDGEHPDNPRGVEVHTWVGERLRAIRYDITAAMWAGATPGSYAGALGLTAMPAALMQHLLIHTCHNVVNRRLRFIQLYDIATLAPHVAPADWAAMADTAIEAGEARLLYAPLALAEASFGPLAPAAVTAALAAATPAALQTMLAHSTPSALSLCACSEISPTFRLSWYHPGRERLGALLRVLLPAADELRQRYPTEGRATAYLRHLGHTLGWAARLAAGVRRLTAGQ